MEYLFLFLLFVVAFLYSSVGHGGGSGYLALMALFGMAPESMRSTSLTLNIFVSLIAFLAYYKGGYFRPKLVFPVSAHLHTHGLHWGRHQNTPHYFQNYPGYLFADCYWQDAVYSRLSFRKFETTPILRCLADRRPLRHLFWDDRHRWRYYP